MGLIPNVLQFLFGDGRNVVAETMGVFRENAEAGAVRDAEGKQQALAQFAAEFGQPRKGLFDRFIDGLNRLPRPMLAFGTIGLFITAMVNPIWFASRMQGIALVPEPLWWLMGAIVSFYFGARTQAKSEDFQRSVMDTALRAGQVTRQIRSIEALNAGTTLTASEGTVALPPRSDEVLAGADQAPEGPSDNPALDDWRASR